MLTIMRFWMCALFLGMSSLAAFPAEKFVGKPLPFEVEEASASRLYKGDLRVAEVSVWVRGGTKADWGATAIVIADAVGKSGHVDSVRVMVRNADVRDLRPVGALTQLARAYHGPNKAKSVWTDTEWAIFLASTVASRRDVEIFNAYQQANEELISRGTDVRKADEIAGKAIARRFGLKKDWRLPPSNIGNAEYGRDRFDVMGDLPREDIAKVISCLNNPLRQPVSGCR